MTYEKFNFNESEQNGLSLDDGFPSLSKLRLQDEVRDPLEDIDPSVGRIFLPGYEDELLAGHMEDLISLVCRLNSRTWMMTSSEVEGWKSNLKLLRIHSMEYRGLVHWTLLVLAAFRTLVLQMALKQLVNTHTESSFRGHRLFGISTVMWKILNFSL